jgi:hypothetical protein
MMRASPAPAQCAERLILAFWSTRRSFTCIAWEISLISTRKPSRRGERESARLVAVGAVNAPLAITKSSLSRESVGKRTAVTRMMAPVLELL